ncbi:MAG: hypothetical protein R2788_18905 [Saprospiraceae bacterium]
MDFEWNFNTDLFRRETIRVEVGGIKQFLAEHIVEPETPIAELRLLPDFESQQLSFRAGRKWIFRSTYACNCLRSKPKKHPLLSNDRRKAS